MVTLNHSGSNDKTTEILPSHLDQQNEQIVLPPFSGELNVDDKLILSHENFQQTIKDFFEDKNLTPLSQITATPPFPTPHVLAQFANKTYTDYNKPETDAQYEKRLDLPEGWEILTTASNSSMANGYFGAAYWHPEHQQVVVAHRGTILTNLGALWTDIRGIVRNHYVSQMKSASTFAHRVVEVLQKVSQIKEVSFQLFFTGHSLGGWLAQITTFTTKYLKIEGNKFLKSDDAQDCYHPHTVVFDSPGCKDMLSQMTEKLDVRLDGRSIDIEHLDITSYLSAPNRINTCNAHVGTVYRIFTDLSDMGWFEKHTALYNTATHSMQKIVEAFDPNTGQVRKDEQGKLKVHVVIDWPVSAGLRGGEEYRNFFKRAKHLNDYHQEVTDVTFEIEGYHPLRYQTTTYNERVTRLSVFCQQEQQFLESYRWLRQLPDFFKPKELFSVMNDNKVLEEAEEILKSFEIENDKIRCTEGGTALQDFIPYVKRLLQLFPEVKIRTELALSSDEVRNRFYQIETKRYIDRISQSPLHFKGDDLTIRDFVRSDHEQVLQLQMVGGDEWTGIVKVHQVLQKTGCLSEGQYTILKLKRLLSVNQLMDFSTVMLSTGTPYLLLMACDTNLRLNDEAKKTIKNILKTIKLKPGIKIVLSTRSESSTLPDLQPIIREIFGTAFVTRDERLTWSDLTTSSQEELLKKSVKFQGTEIYLNQLLSAESLLTKSLPLGDLLGEKQLPIGDPVPSSSGYNEGYYIGRTLRHHRAIKKEILIDKPKEEFSDLIASTQQEFKQLCQNNPQKNVHWLETDMSGKLLWQQSQGSLETLRKYIDTDSSPTYTPDDLDKLLEQAEHQRVLLISDTAGMGKSTLLTHLSKQIKQKFPTKWVVRIDLIDHTDALEAVKQEQFDKEKATEFLSAKVLKHKPGLEAELFKQGCEQKQKVRIVIMLDGFDEISPSNKETVIDLLRALRQTAVEQLWVTTRSHLRYELEDRLQQLSYTLQPFSKQNQIEFLTKFWSLKGWVAEIENKKKWENNKLEIYAKHLIEKLSISISDRDREFTGIPLQTRMLTEAFEKEVKIFCQSAESIPDLPFKLDLIGLYGKFIESKYDIYQEEKLQIRKTNVGATELRKRDLKDLREDNQMLALNVLFNKETVTMFQDGGQCTFSAKELSRFGIVQVSHEGKLHFIHRTFAEYYVADFLVNGLTEENNSSQQIQNFILKDIFLESEYMTIRVFIDGLLSISKSSIKNEVLQQYGNLIHEIEEYGVKILHQAAREDNANIVEFLLDSVQVGERKETVNELLLKQDDERQTAWHKAALVGSLQVLERLWDWAKKVLTPRELKNELLLAKLEFQINVPYNIFSVEYEKHTVLQKVAEKGKTEIFRNLCDCIKEELTTDEIKNGVFLAKDEREQTVWHMAAKNDNIHIVQKIWDWAKEMKLTTEEFNNKLLLAKDDTEQTAFHIAAKGGKTQVLQKIWECSTEKLSAEEINELLLAEDDMKEMAFHCAARFGETEVLQKLWEWGNEKLSSEELRSNLLLHKNDKEQTAFHVAAYNGETEVLQKLWDWGKEKLNPEELKNTFLLADDYSDDSVLHNAAYGENGEAVRKLCAWAKEELNPEELKNKFLLAKSEDLTAFQVAASEANIKALHEIWECAKEILTKEELNYSLLLAKDEMGRTVWHNAVVVDQIEVLETLWEWAKQELTPDELNKNLLLGKDKIGKTAWHLAAQEHYTNKLLKIWEWAKEELTTEELHNSFLLAADDEEHTAWHVAIDEGRTDILIEIWDCAKKELNPEKLYNELLLAKFEGGTTAWHVTANRGNEEVLEELWVWAKEIQTTQELNENLLLVRDQKGRTALHVATFWRKTEVVEKLWEFANEETTKTTAEVVKNLLLATDNFGVTAWQTAVIPGDKYLLEQLWEWAKETLTTDELKHKMFLAKNSWGGTALHVAADKNNTELLDILWEWGKEQLTTEELSNKFLLAKDDRKMTAWHVAADCGNINSLQTIWEWAKQELTAEELKNRLLLAKNNREKTAFEVAAEEDNTEVLEILQQWALEALTPEELNNISCLSTH